MEIVPKPGEIKRARVLLADDNPGILSALSSLLGANFEVIDKVSDGLSLVEAAARLRPDVIVTDISMPRLSGIEAVRRILAATPSVRCVFFTMHTAGAYRREAERAGAAGYVLKS